MNNENQETPVLQATLRMIDNLLAESASQPTLLPILSVLCLITILERTQPIDKIPVYIPPSGPVQTPPPEPARTTTTNEPPLQDMLLSLLPLLNTPQLKSKITPSNISNLLNILSIANNSTKSDHSYAQAEKTNTHSAGKKEIPLTTETVEKAANSDSNIDLSNAQSSDKKLANGNLNWKTNF